MEVALSILMTGVIMYAKGVLMESITVFLIQRTSKLLRDLWIWFMLTCVK